MKYKSMTRFMRVGFIQKLWVISFRLSFDDSEPLQGWVYWRTLPRSWAHSSRRWSGCRASRYWYLPKKQVILMHIIRKKINTSLIWLSILIFRIKDSQSTLKLLGAGAWKLRRRVIFTRRRAGKSPLSEVGGKLICQDYLVVGRPKDQISIFFRVDTSV